MKHILSIDPNDVYLCMSPFKQTELDKYSTIFPIGERDKELIFDAAFNLLLIQYKCAVFEKFSLSACLLLPSTDFDLILAS